MHEPFTPMESTLLNHMIPYSIFEKAGVDLVYSTHVARSIALLTGENKSKSRNGQDLWQTYIFHTHENMHGGKNGNTRPRSRSDERQRFSRFDTRLPQQWGLRLKGGLCVITFAPFILGAPAGVTHTQIFIFFFPLPIFLPCLSFFLCHANKTSFTLYQTGNHLEDTRERVVPC